MITTTDAIELLKKHIPDEHIQSIVINHSEKVQEVAINIANDIPDVDIEFIKVASLLHDIGRMGCPPRSKTAILHGVKGAAILREEGRVQKKEEEFEAYARVAERHLGAGIRKITIEKQNLPLPKQDFLPETVEEKIITVADNLVEPDNGNYVEITIEKAVERFTNELGEEIGQRIKNLYDEVMNIKKK